MANRVSIGRRSSSNNDRGFNVSGLQSGSLTNFSDVTSSAAIHNFDSSDVVGGGLSVFKFGQGQIATAGSEAVIHHQWASMVIDDSDSTKIPLFAVRWNFASDLTNGKATQVYHPNYYTGEHEEETDNCEDEEDGEENCETETFYVDEGISIVTAGNVLRIKNECHGVNSDSLTNQNAKSIYYAYVIFYQEDFTNGKGI
jgi:hypothetical protein